MRQKRNISQFLYKTNRHITGTVISFLLLFYFGCEKTIEPVNTFNVEGIVYIRVGTTDLPVSGAVISLSNKVDTTDSQGYFTFSKIPVGEQSIHITHPDHIPKDTVITITQNLNLKFSMDPATDYILPNAVGNSWTYLITDSSGIVTDTVYSTVLGKIVGPDQEILTQIRYGTLSTMWYDKLFSFNNGTIFKHLDDVISYKIKLYEEPLSVGQIWVTQYQNDLFDTVRVEEIIDIIGPSETYTSCYRIRHISYQFSFEVAVNITDYYLKPGVGFVQIYHYNDIIPFDEPNYYWMKMLSYSIIIID